MLAGPGAEDYSSHIKRSVGENVDLFPFYHIMAINTLLIPQRSNVALISFQR